MQKILMMIVACLLSVSVQAQSQMFAQILANGEVITDGEGGSTPTAGVDTSDYSRVLNYGWTGELALDPTSGIVTAREKYGPLRIVKPLARSSVLLRQALDENQGIDLTLRLFAADDAGADVEVYRIDLVNGRVVGIRPFSDGGTGQYLEEVRLAWQSIEFTDVQTGTSHVTQFPSAP